jgi:hypothetical protein
MRAVFLESGLGAITKGSIMSRINSRYVLAIAAAVAMICAGCASTPSDTTATAHSPAQVKAQANKQ